MKKIAQDNENLKNNLRILLENKTKKFPLNNIVELIIKNYAPDIKVTQQNNSVR